MSAPTAQFSATTSARGITSADNATFAAGSAGTFTVTTAGFSSPTLSDAGFTGCTPSTLPGTLTFTDDHDGTATLAGTPAATSAGSYTVCINASDDTGAATQTFTLTVSQAPPPGFRRSCDHKRKLDELLRGHREQLPDDGVGESGAHILECGLRRVHSLHLAFGHHLVQQRPPVRHSGR